MIRAARTWAVLGFALFILPAMGNGSREEIDPQKVHVRDLELGEIVRRIAVRVRAGEPGDTTRALPRVVWLIDASPFMGERDQYRLLADGIQRHFAAGDAKHAVMMMGAHEAVPVKGFTDDPAAAAGEVRGLKEHAVAGTKNWCSAVRRVLKSLSEYGAIHVVLFTLENLDHEDDLDGTVAALVGRGAVFHVIGREAVLSDPYGAVVAQPWIRDQEGRRSTIDVTYHGPESAYAELPCAWLTSPEPFFNVYIGSGWGLYGPAYAVARTGGSYSLYYPPLQGLTFCMLARCGTFVRNNTASGCDVDHRTGEACWTTYKFLDSPMPRTTAASVGPSWGLGPDLIPRADYILRYSADPLALALFDLWERAWKAELLCMAPPLVVRNSRLTEGKGLSTPRTLEQVLTPLIHEKGWDATAAWARERRRIAAELRTMMDAALEQNRTDRKPDRILASADVTAAQLEAVEVCMTTIEEFALEQKKGKAPNEGSLWIDYESFCHVPVTEKGAEEADDDEPAVPASLRARVHRVALRWKQTPWELAARRIAVVHLRYIPPAPPGNGGTPQPPPPVRTPKKPPPPEPPPTESPRPPSTPPPPPPSRPSGPVPTGR